MSALRNFKEKVLLFFRNLKTKVWNFLKNQNLRLVIKKEGDETIELSLSRNFIMKRLIFEGLVPDIVDIHFPIEISKSVKEKFYRPLRKSSKPYLQEVGKRGRKIIEGLFAIKGIVEVTIEPYELSIIKGKCFSWEKIKPQVKEAIRRAL